MKTNVVKLVFAVISLVGSLLLFQNCSGKFSASSVALEQNLNSLFFAPEVIMSNVSDLVNSSVVTINFDVTGSPTAVTCKLNADPPSDCSSKTVSFSGLSDGDYSLLVTASSVAGTSSRTKVFRKDTQAPVITMAMTPPQTTNQTTTTFVFSVSDNLSGVSLVECSLNNVTFATCASPVNLSGLIAGSHNFRFRARDLAGNMTSVYSYSWTIDLTAPTVTLTTDLLAVTNATTASFRFSGSGASTFECQLDNGVYAACTSPRDYSNIAAGAHNFRVRGISATGVVSSPSLYTWNVDLTAPANPVITGNTSAFTNARSASFNFSATDVSGIASYQCSVDNAAFALCTSPRVFSDLPDGVHSIRVIATDSAKNQSAVSGYSWTVDGVAPVLSFNPTPPSSSTSNNIVFTFTAADALSGLNLVQCSLDNATFTNCTSPVSLSGLSTGATHSFRVQARDNANNTILITHSWSISSEPPPPPPPVDSKIKVRMFLSGHSLTDDPLAENIFSLSNSLGKNFAYNEQIVIGSPLRARTKGGDFNSPNWPGYAAGKNRNGSSGLNVINELRNPTTIGSGELYDTLVVTDRHDILDVIQWEDYIGFLRHYHDRIIDGNPAARTYFFHSWLDIDKNSPQQWIDHEKNALNAWECVANKANHSIQASGRNDRILTLPAGAALVDLVERIQRNEVRDISGTTSQKLNIIFQDNVHLTSLGVYYISLVTFSAIFRTSPAGGGVPSGISPATAEDLQRIAWNFVNSYYNRPAAGVHSMEECRSLISQNVCMTYYTLKGLPERIASCRSFYSNSGDLNNPFRWPDPSMRIWPAP